MVRISERKARFVMNRAFLTDLQRLPEFGELFVSLDESWGQPPCEQNNDIILGKSIVDSEKYRNFAAKRCIITIRRYSYVRS